MKYLILLALLASCGKDTEMTKQTRTLHLQCVSNNNGTTCYGGDIKCTQEYWNNGEMSCEVTHSVEVEE